MTHTEFVQLVKDMRQAQKDYFRTRTNASLVASKDLESQVDKAVKEFITPPAPQLFDK